MNGAYAAMNLLRAGRLPLTGKRPEAAPAGADVIDMTGKKLTDAEVAAAAAAAALIGSGEKREAPRNIEEVNAEYNAALEEQKEFLEERASLKVDARILVDINEIKNPVARLEAIMKNLPLIAEYLQLFDASASVEEIRQMFPDMEPNEAEDFKKFISKMNEKDFYAKVIEPGLSLSGNERILFIETALTNALMQSKRMFKTTSEREAEIKARVAALEKELADAKPLTPEQALAREINEAEAKLMEISRRINDLNEELNKARLLPPSPENNFRLVELTLTMKNLRAEKVNERRRLDELNARRKKLAAEAKTKPAAATTPVGVGKYEPIKPVEMRPDSQLAADISEGENQLSRNAKPSEREPIDRETEIKETLKLAREIIDLRKKYYTNEIRSGIVNDKELRQIKERLAITAPGTLSDKTERVKKVLQNTDRNLLVHDENFQYLKPYIGDLYDKIMIDTDALIALAQKTEVARSATGDNAPPGPDEVVMPDLADEPKHDAHKEKREAAATVMAASRKSIETKATEAEIIDPKGLENAYKEINAPEGLKAVKKLLLDKGVLAAPSAEKLTSDEIFALRYELAAVYLKEIGKRAAARGGEKAEPKPVPKSLEREAAEKIVESAKAKFAARIEEVAVENLHTVEKLYRRLVNAKKENAVKELTDILINGDCLTDDERTKLTPTDLNALRNEAINICWEKISNKDTKKQPPKAGEEAPPTPGPKPVEAAPPITAKVTNEGKEPRSKAYHSTADALAAYCEKKLAATQITEVRKDTMQFTASIINSLRRMRPDEYRNHLNIVLKFDVPKADIDSLDDEDLELLRKMELVKEVKRSEKEIALSRQATNERSVASTDDSSSPPEKDKEKQERAMGEAERILDEMHGQTMSSIDAGSVETLNDAITALENVSPEVYREHLIQFGLIKNLANTLSDENIARLRGKEIIQVQEARDLSEKKRKQENDPDRIIKRRATELNRILQEQIKSKPAIVIPKKGISAETLDEIEISIRQYLNKDPSTTQSEILDKIRKAIKK